MTKTKATGIKKYIPNILSFIRIIGSFSLLFLMHNRTDINQFESVPLVWLIVYTILVLTDKFDGSLARKYNAKSDLGAFLDAFADVVLLVLGAATVFLLFAKENQTPTQTWIYVGILIFCLITRTSTNIFAKKYFGTANMLHSYPQKLFAAGCFIAVAIWAFLGDVPIWSIVVLVAINIYAVIDEITYCVRAEEYDVDFKGHGLQTYKLRKKS